MYSFRGMSSCFKCLSRQVAFLGDILKFEEWEAPPSRRRSTNQYECVPSNNGLRQFLCETILSISLDVLIGNQWRYTYTKLTKTLAARPPEAQRWLL